MMTVDAPILIRAIDDDAHGQVRGLSDAALLVLAQEVIHRLSNLSRDGGPSSRIDLDGFCMALIEPKAEEAKLRLLRAHENGASHRDLVAGLIRHGHRHARTVESEDELERLVREQARPGDMVVCLGAGTISAWAHELPARLKA